MRDAKLVERGTLVEVGRGRVGVGGAEAKVKRVGRAMPVGAKGQRAGANCHHKPFCRVAAELLRGAVLLQLPPLPLSWQM